MGTPKRAPIGVEGIALSPPPPSLSVVAGFPPSSSQPMEAKVDKTRLVMRVSGKFCAKEASSGDVVTMNVGLLSFLPVELELEGLEVRRIPSLGFLPSRRSVFCWVSAALEARGVLHDGIVCCVAPVAVEDSSRLVVL